MASNMPTFGPICPFGLVVQTQKLLTQFSFTQIWANCANCPMVRRQVLASSLNLEKG